MAFLLRQRHRSLPSRERTFATDSSYARHQRPTANVGHHHAGLPSGESPLLNQVSNGGDLAQGRLPGSAETSTPFGLPGKELLSVPLIERRLVMSPSGGIRRRRRGVPGRPGTPGQDPRRRSHSDPRHPFRGRTATPAGRAPSEPNTTWNSTTTSSRNCSRSGWPCKSPNSGRQANPASRTGSMTTSPRCTRSSSWSAAPSSTPNRRRGRPVDHTGQRVTPSWRRDRRPPVTPPESHG